MNSINIKSKEFVKKKKLSFAKSEKVITPINLILENTIVYKTIARQLVVNYI